MSKEVRDIRSAIDFLEKKYSFKKLFLMGISTGAIDASLYAHKDKRITGVVLIAGVSDLKTAVHYDFTNEQITQFKSRKYIVYDHLGKWYQGKRLKKAFYDEFFTLNIMNALKKYHGSLFIIHGDKDNAVPVAEAYNLYRIANDPKQLAIVKGADHKFSSLFHGLELLYHIVCFIRKY